jgi:hypothetical protein
MSSPLPMVLTRPSPSPSSSASMCGATSAGAWSGRSFDDAFCDPDREAAGGERDHGAFDGGVR